MKCTGLITVKVDGDTIFAKSGQITFNPGGYERVAVYADGHLIGYTEKPICSSVSGTCQHTSETDMRALADHDNVSITLDLDSGPKYLIDGAFATKPPELSGETGDLEIEYNGQPAKRL
jgi:hypothetical protein